MRAKWSELDMIALFSGRTGAVDTEGLIKGIGDDCAIFTGLGQRHWLVTTDILIERVHFDRSWHPPSLLGRKSIAVNLSDIAAMGGTPHYALVSIALPEQIERDWVAQWSAGAADMLEEFGCTLIGGDTVKGKYLTFNIVILGSAAEGETILRSTAGAEENIYVSGGLGFAAAGLEICRNPEQFKSFTKNELEPLINKHLDPMPRVHLGEILAASGMVSAMQDISDGIATDLAHICTQSGVGAVVEEGLLPGASALQGVCRTLNCEVVELQVSGGEDYELLFTVKQGKDEDLLALLRAQGGGQVYRVGRTVGGDGVRLLSGGRAVDIAYQGFQHTGERG